MRTKRSDAGLHIPDDECEDCQVKSAMITDLTREVEALKRLLQNRAAWRAAAGKRGRGRMKVGRKKGSGPSEKAVKRMAPTQEKSERVLNFGGVPNVDPQLAHKMMKSD